MRIAHLADLHLGFFQFDRTLPGGFNVREEDVALAFRRAIADVITQQPDAVCFAGDVFHRVRPGNRAIVLFEEQLATLRAALPAATLVMVAGDHDTPKLKETGFILPIARQFGINLALLEPLVVPVPGGSVTAVPFAHASRFPMPAKPTEPGIHVLVSHGDIAGYGNPAPEHGLDPAALEAAGWDYVALGHYHVGCQVSPHVWYAGSLEYDATNPWGELAKAREVGTPGKGYLLVALEPGAAPCVTFRPIGPARPHLDLEPIDATGLDVAAIDAAIAGRMASAAIDDAVVRLVIREIPRDYKRALDHKAIREWKTRALNLQLDMRGPSHQGTPAARQQMHRRLDEYVETMLGQRPLPPDMDRAAFVAKGLDYLKTAAFADDSYGSGAKE